MIENSQIAAKASEMLKQGLLKPNDKLWYEKALAALEKTNAPIAGKAMYASTSSPWVGSEMLNQTSNAGGLKGLYSKFASNPTVQKAGKFGSGAIKAAPYLGLGLMGAQGIGELLEGGSLGRSNEELAGQINLMGQGTPMLNEFMDPNAMKDFENLQRRGNLQEESKLVSGIKGAGSEIPGAALTALLFTLLTGGAGLPLGLAFGAGQLGVGATRGLKNREVEEQSRLQNLYSQLADSQRMSKASRMPATQNYNMR
jgi:hypothetical protein